MSKSKSIHNFHTKLAIALSRLQALLSVPEDMCFLPSQAIRELPEGLRCGLDPVFHCLVR